MGFFRKSVTPTDRQDKQLTSMSIFYGIPKRDLMDRVFEDGLDKWFSKFSKANRPVITPPPKRK